MCGYEKAEDEDEDDGDSETWLATKTAPCQAFGTRHEALRGVRKRRAYQGVSEQYFYHRLLLSNLNSISEYLICSARAGNATRFGSVWIRRDSGKRRILNYVYVRPAKA